MNSAKVAVIIPTHEGSDFIKRSVISVLNQNYTDIQVIVVDDNGRNSDEQLKTANILKKYIDNKQIDYIVHEKSKNGSSARNTGAFYTECEYISFLDDDDELLPDKIEKQVQFLDNNPNIMLTWCGGNILVNDVLSYVRLPEENQVANLYEVLLHHNHGC